MSSGDPSADDASARLAVLGRYRLLERIGEGSMGVVWRSLDLDLEEQVAIKFLREELVRDPRLRACFRREVKLARRITHPNVVRVHELGRADDVFFVTMEHVDGEPLDVLLAREAPIAPARARRTTIALLRGLAAAHSVGVVHGDVKPTNIILHPARGGVLTDFGFARALSAARADVMALWETHLHTPPERLAGSPSDPRGDVYAAGVLLFRALTGATPWPIGEPRGKIRDLRDHTRRLPEGWAELLEACLDPDPAARPRDARALLARLLALRDDDAAPARRSTPRPAPDPAAAGARWIELPPIPSAADEERGAGWIARQAIDALARAQAARLPAPAGADPLGLAETRRGFGEVGTADDAAPVPAAGGARDAAERAAAPAPRRPRTVIHDLAADLTARIVAAADPEAILALCRHAAMDLQAAALYLQARSEAQAMRTGPAIELYEAALRRHPDHPLIRLGHTLARVDAVFFTFRPPSASEVAEVRRAVEDTARAHPDHGEAYLARALVALALDDPITCARATREAIVRAPGLASAQFLLADLLLRIDRLADAERHLNIALTLDPGNAQVWTARARLLAHQGRWRGFYGLVEGRLAELRHRGAHLPRLMLWRPDAAALGRLGALLAANADGLAAVELAVARDLVAFAQGGDRRAIYGRFTAHAPHVHPRHRRFLRLCRCELACLLGELEEAHAHLAQADAEDLAEWAWIEACPLLDPLRGDPRFRALRERVRVRAEAIAAAIWG